MSTCSRVQKNSIETQLCQGDIFSHVKYAYIDNEEADIVNVIEMEFPFAMIISQACDVIAMEKIVREKRGKSTKLMTSILMCPIIDGTMLKNGAYAEDFFTEFQISKVTSKKDEDRVYDGKDKAIAERDWHYRFHLFKAYCYEAGKSKELLFDSMFFDFKQYFTVPITYLLKNKKNRICTLEELYAEQITLKFATYLSRVAMPD